MFGRKRLPIDLILRSEKDFPPKCNHKEYLEAWKKETEGAFEVALTKSTGRKQKDVQRKLKSGPCLGILEPRNKVLVRNSSQRGSPGNLRSFWEQVAEVIQRHENDVTYTIKTIAQPEKVRTLHRNMLAMRKETMEQDQRDLSNQSDAAEGDEEGLELTPRQLLQLHSITPQVPKQRQFGTSSRPNLKQAAPKEVQELTSDLTKEGTNVDFEVSERSAKSSDKIRAPVYPTQNKNKTHKPSSKITPTILNTTKNKARVTKVVEITDMPKVSNIDKPSYTRIKKIIEILDTPALPVNTADQALTTETPPPPPQNLIELKR